jgi:hypothetical protein
LNSVAVIKWKGGLPSDDKVGADPATRYSADFGEQWAYQACQPVAFAVLEAIRALGHKTDVVTPYFGENCWHFALQFPQQSFSVTVQWVSGDKEKDLFAIQFSVRRGCIASLFLPHPEENLLRPVCEILREALAGHPRVAAIEWVEKT